MILPIKEKYRPLIKNRVQRMAAHSIVAFFTLIFGCTVLSRVSHSFMTAGVCVSAMTSGTLTNRAEAEGTIQAAAERSMTLPQGQKVVTVNAEKGSRVNEGEALLTFDTASMEEQVKKLEEEIHILNLKVELSGIGSGNDVPEAQRALLDAQKAYERTSAKYVRSDARLKEDYTKLEEKLAEAETRKEKAAAEAKQELIKTAEAAVEEAEENLESVKDAAGDAVHAAEKELSEAEDKASDDSDAAKLDPIKERWEKKIKKAKEALEDAREELTEAKERTDFSGEAAVLEAEAAIDAVKGSQSDVLREFEDCQYLGEEELYQAQRAVETAQTALENAGKRAAVSQKESEITRLTYESEAAEKEKLRSMLQEILDQEGRMPAPASGTVLHTVEKGAVTEGNEDTVTLSCDDRGFIFEGALDQESAQRFTAGDKGELLYASDGGTQKLEVEIHSVGAPDEDGQAPVTVILPEGSFSAGMPAQLSLNKKSGSYQSCLPITALRSDSRGDHVLVIRKQNSVLGTEWVTERVAITVQDRDSQMMSIESTLTYSDQVIISSNKAIAEGDRVRIEKG